MWGNVTVNYDKENVVIEDGVYEFLKLKKQKKKNYCVKIEKVVL